MNDQLNLFPEAPTSEESKWRESQLEQVKALMLDGKPRSLRQIGRKVPGHTNKNAPFPA